MRIAIFTLPLHTNYGGILQTYALQTVLKRMGHEVTVIDRDHYPHFSKMRRLLMYAKRLVKKYLMRRKNTIVFIDKYREYNYSIISQFTKEFIERHIARRVVNNILTLKKNDFDVLIVGSDQVWRPLYYGSKIENAYFDFAQSWDVKRIAYAPSFGTDVWEYTQKQSKRCGKLLHSFDAISVREDSGIVLCHKFFKVQAKQVLDPTMLLDVDDYIQIMEDSACFHSEGTLFCYILDETKEKMELVEHVATDKNLVPYWIKPGAGNTLEELIQPPVESWLRAFYDAEFIVTDSFHACVFSILFNKPFIVYGNEDRGMTRFHSLLTMFDIEGVLIMKLEDYEKVKMQTIDFVKVEKRLKLLREESFCYLFNSLHDK